MSAKLVSVLFMFAAFLAMARAACQCDDADQACVSRCVKDAEGCITDCKGDTKCYEGCIGDKWPHASDSIMQMMSTSAMASSASSTAAPTSAAKAQSSGSSASMTQHSSSASSSETASASHSNAASPLLPGDTLGFLAMMAVGATWLLANTA
ncbi:hypothetical protein O0I10_004459 [Lichtheimia ornata]|uniref:Uncharacterized protein n=1 Tax=Lichtheimia ornata TaxID=688661 RepID=A0AAD7V7D5_9FUNG|nr:uncharacterized protein O0I10_004459 [Lichtheimia ornata]KAJ8659866.1 hypothetical protein O0I10_004459 [Lichtheimia ornata]